MFGESFRRLCTRAPRKLLIGTVLLAVTFLCPALAQRNMVFTQFAAGEGLSCDQFFTNQGSLAVTVTVSFFDGAGAALTVTSNLGTAASYSFDLGLGETKVIRFPATGSLKTGYVVVSTPENSSVPATQIFRYELGGSVLFEVGAPQQEAGRSFNFPAEVKLSSGTSTGMALAYPTFGNSATAPLKAIVNLIRTDGVLEKVKVIDLEPGEYLSLYLHEPGLFPGLDNFTGSVLITGIADFSAMGLRQDKNGVGSLAVSTGPVLGPFLLASAPVNEVEPNDTRSQSQVLMGDTLVSGVISQEGGIDYFRFAGKRGDIVSFVGTSEGIQSSITAAMELHSEDRTMSAYCDWMGLMGTTEPYLQAVLPADGTYYVDVLDRRGGASGLYRLHARVPTNTGPLPPPPAPLLKSLGPLKAMRGSTFRMVIMGTDLAGVSALTFAPPPLKSVGLPGLDSPLADGITAEVVAGDDKSVEATVSIPAAMNFGFFEVTATAPGRTSNILEFEVLPGGGDAFNLDGDWAGKTSEGYFIKFKVAGGKLTEISFSAIVYSGPLGCFGTKSYSAAGLQTPVATTIEHAGGVPGGLGAALFGTFDSPDTASGWLKMSTASGCAGVGIATWTATRTQ